MNNRSSFGQKLKKSWIFIDTIKYQFGSCIRTTVNCSNIEFRALIDTGASRSILNSVIFDKFDTEIRSSQTPSNVVLIDVNGHKLSSIGQIELNLHIMGITVEQNCIIVAGINEGCNFGNDIIGNAGLLIDGAHMTVPLGKRLHESESIKMDQRGLNNEGKTQAIQSVEIFCSKGLVIPPFTAKTTNGNCLGKTLNNNCEWIFEPNEKLSSDLCPDSAIMAVLLPNKIPIILSNDSNRPIQINRGDLLGVLESDPDIYSEIKAVYSN